MNRVSAIAAIGARTRALGKGNDLLFKIPEDLKRFRDITRGHPVIMGRKTWESLPDASRPLPGRTNIIVSRNTTYQPMTLFSHMGKKCHGSTCVHTAQSIRDAIQQARETPGAEETFVIGGSEIFSLALPYTDRLYLTLVESDTEGDVYFPEYEKAFTKKVSEEHSETDGLRYRFVTLER
jgi:dihydrofolate reductase